MEISKLYICSWALVISVLSLPTIDAKPTAFVTHLCSSCFSIGRNRIFYITPECTSVVTAKTPYHAGLFSASKSIQISQVFKVLFLWNVPLINDSRVLAKMRDEGDSACGLQAMLAILGIFHGVQGIAGYTYFRNTFLLVLISFFRIISWLILKNFQKDLSLSCF